MKKTKNDVKYAIYLSNGMEYFVPVVVID